MKIKFLAFAIAAFLFIVTSNIGYADDSKLTIEQLIEDRTKLADVNHWCEQQKINRPELRDVWRQIEVCKNALVASAIGNDYILRAYVKEPEPWPGKSTNFFAEAALMDGAKNNRYRAQNAWCLTHYTLRTKDVTWSARNKPDYRSVSNGCAAAYPVTVSDAIGRNGHVDLVTVNGKRFLDAAGQAKEAKEQAEYEQKYYISQGGLTWMPVTFNALWERASNYCNNTTIKGQRGWRLPTKGELMALSVSGAAVEVWKGRYGGTWTSTPNDITPDNKQYEYHKDWKYYVLMHSKGAAYPDDNDNLHYVTCVR